MRSRASAARSRSPSRLSISVSQSASPSGSSRRDVAFSLPPLQSGRASSSSVRATQSRKIGASRERSATCSTRSTNSGSAHCRSSITATCGRSAARASSSLRNATLVSAGVEASDALRLDPERHQHLDERPVRDPLAVREAAAAQHVRVAADAVEEVGDESRLAHTRRTEEREELTGAVGDSVLEGAPESLALAFTSDERRARGRGRSAAASLDDVEEPVGLDRLRLPLEHRGARRGSTRTASRTSACVSAPISIVPGVAACSSRAATLTASPVTSVSPRRPRRPLRPY